MRKERRKKGKVEGRRETGGEVRNNLVKTINESTKNLCNHFTCSFHNELIFP